MGDRLLVPGSRGNIHLVINSPYNDPLQLTFLQRIFYAVDRLEVLNPIRLFLHVPRIDSNTMCPQHVLNALATPFLINVDFFRDL